MCVCDVCLLLLLAEEPQPRSSEMYIQSEHASLIGVWYVLQYLLICPVAYISRHLLFYFNFIVPLPLGFDEDLFYTAFFDFSSSSQKHLFLSNHQSKVAQKFSFSIQFYLYSAFYNNIASRCFTESKTLSQNLKGSTVARKNSLLTGRNLEKDPACREGPSCWESAG